MNAIGNKSDTLDAIYTDVIKVVKWHNNMIVPSRKLKLRDSENPYITPDINILLGKRNKLHRAGKAEASDFQAMKID